MLEGTEEMNMPSIEKVANIYTKLQNLGSRSSGQYLDRGLANPEKRQLKFKEVLKEEISKVGRAE